MSDEKREARIKELLNRRGDPLRLHDWNFDDCPEDQRRACFYYEYLREAQREGRIHQADWEVAINYDPFTDDYDPEKVKPWFAAQEKLGRAIRLPLYTRDWAQGLIRAPWPTEPWLDLDNDEGTRRTERRSARIYFRHDLAHIAAANPVPLQPYEVCGLVIFQKGITVEELNEIFATEVKALAKAQPELFEQREKRQGGWLPKLHQLGAQRLRTGLKQYFKSRDEKFIDQDVIAYSALTLRSKKNPFWYRRSGDLIKAAQNAGKHLERLVPKN
jgi:hypothetical protein